MLKPSNADPYIWYEGQGASIVLVPAYIDDILIISQYVNKVEDLKVYWKASLG